MTQSTSATTATATMTMRGKNGKRRRKYDDDERSFVFHLHEQLSRMLAYILSEHEYRHVRSSNGKCNTPSILLFPLSPMLCSCICDSVFRSFFSILFPWNVCCVYVSTAFIVHMYRAFLWLCTRMNERRAERRPYRFFLCTLKPAAACCCCVYAVCCSFFTY